MKFFKLIRISHWVKNLFVFAPLFFGGMLLDWHSIEASVHAFFVFSFAASSIYVINDLKDRHEDALHPEKRNRPIASGAVAPGVAVALAIMLIAVALLISYFVSLKLFFIIAGYFLLNLSYTYGLKQVSIVDINIIAIGFVLRVLAGGAASGIYVSHWLIIMVFLLSLFLAIAKRRDDLVLIQDQGMSSKVRLSLQGYNIEFVNTAIALLASLIMVCYIMYITSEEVVERLNFSSAYFTLVFVLAGLFRYLQVTYIFKKSGSPTSVLIKDRFIQVAILLWILSFTYILYIHPWFEKF